ncbi:MAG: hypothetical protein ACFFDF_23495 [Candidatus Odinarchaeota archaeon]
MNYRKFYIATIVFFLYCGLFSFGNSTIFNNNHISNNNINSSDLSIANGDSWEVTWGSIGADPCYAFTKDSLDNFYLIGETATQTDSYCAVIKFNSSGGLEWAQSEETMDFGYIITTDYLDDVYFASKVNDDIHLFKYNNSTGSELWNYTWEAPGTYDLLNTLMTDPYNRTYLAGYSGYYESNITLYTLNSTTGTDIWNVSWTRGLADLFSGMVLDPLNNTYLYGNSMNNETYDYDACVIKFNSTGGLLWNVTWGGDDDEYSSTNSLIALDSLNNVYIAGETQSYGLGETDMFLVKYNSAGVKQWEKIYGGISTEFTQALGVDSSNNVYVAGQTSSFPLGDTNNYLIKYDSNGQYQWNYTFGERVTLASSCMVIDSSDNIYIGGEHRYYEITIYKFDSSGDLIWTGEWGGDEDDELVGIMLDSSDNLYLAGTTESYGAGAQDMFLVKNPPRAGGDGVPGMIIPSYNLIILVVLISISSIFLTRKLLNLSNNS